MVFKSSTREAKEISLLSLNEIENDIGTAEAVNNHIIFVTLQIFICTTVVSV